VLKSLHACALASLQPNRDLFLLFPLVVFLYVFNVYFNLPLIINERDGLTGAPLDTGRVRRVTTKVTFQEHTGVGFLKPGFDGTGGTTEDTLIYLLISDYHGVLRGTLCIVEGTCHHWVEECLFRKNPNAGFFGVYCILKVLK